MSTEEAEDFIEASKFIEQKILHVLNRYPKLSHSMLQVGLGTSLSSKMWDPVLNRLIQEGKIKIATFQDKSPSERDQTYHVISLVPDEERAQHADLTE